MTSLQGLLGSDRTVAASRAAARRLLAARPGEGRSVPQARPEELGQVKAWLGEKGQEKMDAWDEKMDIQLRKFGLVYS